MNSNNAQLGMEAAEWLIRLDDDELDPEEPYATTQERDTVFLAWITQSPEHLQVFFETAETHRRLPHMDPQCLIKVRELLDNRSADVIHLYNSSELATRVRHRAVAGWRRASGGLRRRALAPRVAAIVALGALAVLLYTQLSGYKTFATAVGEQRTCKLEDGSFAILNTDSQIDVRFSKRERGIRLIRGEALFIVQHDTSRPFIVSTPGATVRAVGTQFDVRRRDNSTDVAVVEGIVQVTATDTDSLPNPLHAMESGSEKSSSPTLLLHEGEGGPKGRMRNNEGEGSGEESSAGTAHIQLLAAGEEAKVASGHVAKDAHPKTESILAWRQRRLVFYDARMADVAAEFNRYNRTKIWVEGSAAQDKTLTGIFDADRPQSLMLYAAKDDSLEVQPEGNNWVIRAR